MQCNAAKDGIISVVLTASKCCTNSDAVSRLLRSISILYVNKYLWGGLETGYPANSENVAGYYMRWSHPNSSYKYFAKIDFSTNQLIYPMLQ